MFKRINHQKYVTLINIATRQSESGQALIFIVFVFIGLLGFVGLAIDGGRIFTERRQSQNAADNAALAAARALCVSQNLTTAALAVAAANGFDNNGTTNTVTINRPPASGQYAGDSQSIEVIINSTIPSGFISMVYSQPITETSRAVSHCTASQSGGVGGGNAIIVLHPSQSAALSSTGNGNVNVTSGGIFVNSSSNSAMRVTGNGDVHADTISIVGNYSITGNGDITPTPNIHVPTMTDPLASLAPPSHPSGSCTNFSVTGNNNATINPGNYCSISITGNGSLIMNPGDYYVSGNFSATGNGDIVASDIFLYMGGNFSATGNGDVTMHNSMVYMQSGTFSMTGNGSFDVTARTSGAYAGLAVFVDRANSSAVRMTGNGNSNSVGTIYAAASPITLTGNGNSTVINSQIICRTLTTTGNGNINVNYVPSQNVQINTPPSIDLLE